jgi:hypothetical protein
VPLARALSLDLQPVYARNSFEWRRMPIYYPVRELVEQMAAHPTAGAIRSIRLMASGADLIVAPVAYPDLNRRFALHPQPLGAASDCTCRARDEAVLVGIEYRARFALEDIEGPATGADTAACLAAMRQTCRSVLEAFHATGARVGVLGVP